MYLDRTRIGFIILMILSLCSTVPLSAAQVHVTIASNGETSGSTITIPIMVTAEVTVGAAQLELLYDPERLRWVGGDAGKLTTGALIDANLINPGRVKIAFAGGEEVKGTGSIYQATFEWIGKQTEPTSIRFASVRAWDQSGGLELATSVSPGDAFPTVAEPPTPGASNETAMPPSGSPNNYRYVYIAALALLLVTAMATLLRKKSGR